MVGAETGYWSLSPFLPPESWAEVEWLYGPFQALISGGLSPSSPIRGFPILS